MRGSTPIDASVRMVSPLNDAFPSWISGMSTDEVLAHVPDRLVERQTEHALDDELVRQAYAEHEAAAARGLNGERLLRHRQRMAAVGGHDRGGERDAGHLSPHDREHAHRVEGEDLRERVPTRSRPSRRPGRRPPPRRSCALPCRLRRCRFSSTGG